MLKMFPGVSERVYSVAIFSRMLLNVPTCSCSFFELQLKTDSKPSYHAACFITEVILNSHFSSKPVSSGTNSLSAWDKLLLLRVSEYARRFLWVFVILRNNVSV